MEAATKGAGQAISNLDVCKTQAGNSVIIVPYTNTAKLSDAESTADKVIIVGEEAINLASKITSSVTGPNPNIIGGLCSGTINGKCKFAIGSLKVFLQGQCAIRRSDPTTQNSINCFGQVKTTSQTKVIING